VRRRTPDPFLLQHPHTSQPTVHNLPIFQHSDGIQVSVDFQAVLTLNGDMLSDPLVNPFGNALDLFELFYLPESAALLTKKTAPSALA
jgi:hypothetical protein